MANKGRKRTATNRKRANIKRRKSQTNSDESGVTMKIDELNDDCFEEIFNYLKFMDLLNMAATNQRINQVVCNNFARKYSTEAVCVSPKGIYITSPDITEQPDIFMPIDETEKFIRFLGPVIGRLTMNGLDGKRGIGIAKLIFEYCTDSLNEIVLRCLPDNITKLIKKPFSNVENVYINRCFMGKNLSQLNKWFPDMDRLMIYNCEIDNPDIMHFSYPKLTHLTWEHSDNDENAMQCVKLIIKQNSHIESLRLDCAWDIGFLRHVNKQLHRLKTFELSLEHQTVEVKRKVYFHNVSKLVLHLRDQNALAGPLPFTFKRLNEIHLHLDCHDTLTESMVDFLSQYKHLQKLFIFFPVDRQNLCKLALHLPHLEILGLSGIGFSNADAVHALNQFIALRKFRIFNEHRFDDFLDVLGSQWHACADRKYFIKQNV